MKFADPFAIPAISEAPPVIFAASQSRGSQTIQEDYFVNFNDECFVVADGVGGSQHGDEASRLAGETALWGYKHIRERKFYWVDKKKLLKRIFRTTNMAVWQKRRETGFEDGLATTLVVALITPTQFFVGSVGDTTAMLYRETLIDTLTPEDRDATGRLTKVIGSQRLGLVPHVHVDKFLPGDMLLLATDGVVDFVDEEDIRSLLETSGNTSADLALATEALIQKAAANGGVDNMTACLIKKLPQG